MTVIAEVLLRGVTPEQYDAVRARARWVEEVPDGGVAHVTWFDGGDCHNCDAWESEEAFAAFGEQRLGPAMAELGIDAPPEVTFHPAHEVYTPRRGIIAATPVPQGADNVALCRSGYERFAAGDVAGVLALMADDLVWSPLPGISFGGVYQGPAGAGEFFTKLPQHYAELSVTPENYIDAGDTVVVQGTHRGRTVAGTSFEVPFVHVWTMRDGKANGFTELTDSATIALALGEASAATPIPGQRAAAGTTA